MQVFTILVTLCVSVASACRFNWEQNGWQQRTFAYSGNTTLIVKDTIPSIRTTNHSAIMLWINNATEPEDVDKCWQTFNSSAFEESCVREGNCWIYTNPKEKCSLEEILEYYPKTNKSRCLITTYPKNNEIQLRYFRSNSQKDSIFTLLYHPINCSLATSAPWTSTILQHTATTTIATTVAATALFDNNVTKTDKEEENLSSQQKTIIISMAILGVVLIGIVIGAIVCYRKRKSLRETKPDEVAIEEVEHNAISTNIQGPMYVNDIVTQDDDGYEVPNNARQYENLKQSIKYENITNENVTYANLNTDMQIYDNT